MPAQLPSATVVLASLPLLRCAYCQPDLITRCSTLDTLQDQFKIEGLLHLDDNNGGRIVRRGCHDIATVHFALRIKTEALEVVLDRKVE